MYLDDDSNDDDEEQETNENVVHAENNEYNTSIYIFYLNTL